MEMNQFYSLSSYLAGLTRLTQLYFFYTIFNSQMDVSNEIQNRPHLLYTNYFFLSNTNQPLFT